MMKHAIRFLLICLLVFTIPISIIANTDSSEDAVNQWLETSNSHYKEDSVSIKDSIDTSSYITRNGSGTELVNLRVLAIDFKEVKDTFFSFNRHDILYYDEQNNTFHSSSIVERNDEITELYQKYNSVPKKQLSITSLLTLMLLIFLTIFLIPIASMVFHPKAPSDRP
ncbi:hypothetical protein WAK64_20230 [Bacillus spongiae]|uniref:Type VII secretion protein EssA n=1 Tax=Bacillus spongiae TaxID=2683610 RepID=A0ABU8HJ01_9BACI